jgi:hypothetical protein
MYLAQNLWNNYKLLKMPLQHDSSSVWNIKCHILQVQKRDIHKLYFKTTCNKATSVLLVCHVPCADIQCASLTRCVNSGQLRLCLQPQHQALLLLGDGWFSTCSSCCTDLTPLSGTEPWSSCVVYHLITTLRKYKNEF